MMDQHQGGGGAVDLLATPLARIRRAAVGGGDRRDPAGEGSQEAPRPEGGSAAHNVRREAAQSSWVAGGGASRQASSRGDKRWAMAWAASNSGAS